MNETTAEPGQPGKSGGDGAGLVGHPRRMVPSDAPMTDAEKLAQIADLCDERAQRDRGSLFERSIWPYEIRAVLDAPSAVAMRQPRHNHVTRDIKPRGACPACDAYWDMVPAARAGGIDRDALRRLFISARAARDFDPDDYVERVLALVQPAPPALAEDMVDADAVIQRLGDLLNQIAVVLKGPPPPLTSWSYHDLPELVEAAVKRAARFDREKIRGVLDDHVDRYWHGDQDDVLDAIEEATR